MNLLDILLAVIVGGSVVAGFVAGFARAAIGFLAVIVGIPIGFWFYGIPAAWIRRFVSNETAASVLGFLVVFFGVQLAGGLLGKLLSKLFKWTGLSGLDRIFGAGFGLVRGALMAIAFIAVLMAFTPSPLPNWMVGSVVLPYAVDASNACASLAPNALKEAYRNSLAEIRQAWKDQVKKAEEYREKIGGKPSKSPGKSKLKAVEQ